MAEAARADISPPPHAKPRLWFAVATLFVLTLGALEGWYGKTVAGDVYGSDAVQYLDIAQAFERGDLHSALNPLWSQGYPALLAVIRPAFAASREGEWNAIRTLNFAIFAFSWLAFAAFVRELLRHRERSVLTLLGSVCVFLTTQICIDQVSRVGPDQLVAALFFLACTLLLCLRRNPSALTATFLGAVLGIGFLVKSIFLPLGLITLAIAFLLTRRSWKSLPAAAIFAAIVLTYGAALSRAVGTPTLGEAGSLNYAWHVNRLAKWVHWEGGTDPANKAWPKPWIASFTRWQTDPPDFGKPIHPDEIDGSSPAVYVFHAPVQATYVPYYDPPYFYQGYRHLIRWRYEVIALAKNVTDLFSVLLPQPLFWAIMLIAILVRRLDWSLLRAAWPVLVFTLTGIAIYIPVHLEGRYLAAFFAVGAVCLLASLGSINSKSASWGIYLIFLFGFAAGLVKDQRAVWTRAAHHWDYRIIPEWQQGRALQAEGLQPGAEIGVISWEPNVQCDWAYLAGVRITSEIESPADQRAFLALPPAAQSEVLERFHRAGATLVVARDKPRPGATGWHQLAGVPLWIYRF